MHSQCSKRNDQGQLRFLMVGSCNFHTSGRATRDDGVGYDSHDGYSKYESLGVDTFRFNGRVPCTTDWFVGEDHGKGAGTCEGEDKSFPAPYDSMKSADGIGRR